MKKNHIITWTLVGVCIYGLAASQSAQAAKPTAAQKKQIQVVFDNAEKGLRKSNEALFKKQFHPEAYGKNLVGGSGQAGMKVYRQGTRKKWFLKPRWDVAEARAVDVVLVPCEVWLWEGNRSVDRVDAVIVKYKGKWVVLGGGEKRTEVEALIERWKARKPLDPPAAQP